MASSETRDPPNNNVLACIINIFVRQETCDRNPDTYVSGISVLVPISVGSAMDDTATEEKQI
jgi:hypothetical protein